jgi:hypothetical protein
VSPVAHIVSDQDDTRDMRAVRLASAGGSGWWS